MHRKFITNLGLLLALNLLIKPFWMLGIEPIVQHRVGDADYGIYFALFNFSFLLNILLDFGITQFNNKNIAQNNHLLTKHFSSLFVMKLLLAVFYILTTVGIGLVVGYNERYMRLLLVLGFNQFLIFLVLYLRSNLLGLHLFKTDSFVSILDRLIMIAIMLVILFTGIAGGKLELMWFVYAQTAAYLLTAIITFTIVLSHTESFKMKFSLPFSLMILRKSFPFAILVLLMTFYNRIDSVMLERMLGEGGAEQSGIYAKAFRLLDAVNMIAYLFSVQLLPIFSRMLKFSESVENLVKLAFTLLITCSIITAIGSFFFSEEIMKVLYKANIEQSASVFGILMFCFVCISTTYIFGTLLTANGNLKQLNIMAFCGILVNISLNLILIPQMQAKGSAIASVTTQFLTALAQVLIVQKIFRFRVNYRLLITLPVFAAGVAGIAYLSMSFTANWIFNFVLMGVLSAAWAFAIRLMSIKGMFRILKYG